MVDLCHNLFSCQNNHLEDCNFLPFKLVDQLKKKTTLPTMTTLTCYAHWRKNMGSNTMIQKEISLCCVMARDKKDLRPLTSKIGKISGSNSTKKWNSSSSTGPI